MTIEHLHFNFGVFKTSAHIMPELPNMGEIARDLGGSFFKPLLVCDSNTKHLAEKICASAPDGTPPPICVLEAGEIHKNWQSVEAILRAARDAGLGRDGTFIGVGGGVVTDLCAFAASIYMRGASLVLVSTSLLGMVDASLGGKTGFDLFDIKNFAGTFYPAAHVYVPIASLASLPASEWKSGMAEIIKTAVLDGNDFLDELGAITSLPGLMESSQLANGLLADGPLARCISRSLRYKGGIVQEDPLETGNRRVLLNLGHTFGHALEAAATLGAITHGEAVAWGIARSCELGLTLGICPRQRAQRIQGLLAAFGYETRAPHPLLSGGAGNSGRQDDFMQLLGSDKKKRGGDLRFIVPNENSAQIVPSDAYPIETATLMDTISQIVNGKAVF